MYEAYWQLAEKPFGRAGDAKFYYPSEAHQGALLKLRYAVENRRGAALLTGASGLGKTMLVRTLARQLPDEVRPVVHLVFPDVPPEQLLAMLADELTGEAASDSSARESLRRIERATQSAADDGRRPLVVIDEAHLLADHRALETIRLLLNLECGDDPAMTLLLVGQTAILPTLDRTPELEERLGVKSLLRPLSAEETMSYVSHRMTAAGAERDIFEQGALEAVYELTAGAPRRINRLCDLALLIGFAEERTVLAREQIESVCNELVAVSPE